MRAISRTVIAVIALGLAAIFAMHTGVWGDVLSMTRTVLGDKTANHVEQFGNTSKDIYDQARSGELPSMEMPDFALPEAIDWSALGDKLAGIEDTITVIRIPDYRRDAFGKAWADTDGNGCSTREDILARDLTDITRDGCKVLTGTLIDPYSGQTVQFQRGQDTSSEVQIDHIISLSQAWAYGAHNWTNEQRLQFANDPMNLQAVVGVVNTAKSDRGPADWPLNQVNDTKKGVTYTLNDPAYTCSYTAKFVEIIAKYNLTVPQKERRAVETNLAACAGAF